LPNTLGIPVIRGGAIGGGSGGVGDVDEFMVIEGDGRIAGLADVEKFHVDALLSTAAALVHAEGRAAGSPGV
jgi:hypothetical protein